MWSNKRRLLKRKGGGQELIVYFTGDHLENTFTGKVVSPSNPNYKPGAWKTDWVKEKFESL